MHCADTEAAGLLLDKIKWCTFIFIHYLDLNIKHW